MQSYIKSKLNKELGWKLTVRSEEGLSLKSDCKFGEHGRDEKVTSGENLDYYEEQYK